MLVVTGNEMDIYIYIYIWPRILYNHGRHERERERENILENNRWKRKRRIYLIEEKRNSSMRNKKSRKMETNL